MIRRRATLMLGVVGLALLATAAARVIYTSSGAGIVTLLIIGAVLLISPFVIARVERLSVNAHTSVNFQGYIKGALRSGYRCAAEITGG